MHACAAQCTTCNLQLAANHVSLIQCQTHADDAHGTRLSLKRMYMLEHQVAPELDKLPRRRPEAPRASPQAAAPAPCQTGPSAWEASTAAAAAAASRPFVHGGAWAKTGYSVTRCMSRAGSMPGRAAHTPDFQSYHRRLKAEL